MESGHLANPKHARNIDLDTLATHPDYQKRGAGSMIVKYGCDLADAHGVSAYVDASKEGLGLYKRHGFVNHGDGESDVASMARFHSVTNEVSEGRIQSEARCNTP